MAKTSTTIEVNRAPVLTLWAAVVAERLGFDWDEALTLGRAVAGLNAYSKGVRLGLFTPAPKEVKEHRSKAAPGDRLEVALLGRAVPVVHTADGLRAISKDQPIKPKSVETYIASKLGDATDDVRQAMQALAKSRPPKQLALEAFHLYEQFRPAVPGGAAGWGAKGKLDLATIRKLAAR